SLSLLLPPPRPPLPFPYTTLFRSLPTRLLRTRLLVRLVDGVILLQRPGQPFEARRTRGALRKVPPATSLHREGPRELPGEDEDQDRKSTRLNSSHVKISYAVFCLK